MAFAKFENFTNQRALEKWARKEREQRIDIVLAVHYLDDKLAEETKYMQMKNISLQLSQLKLNYTAVNNLELPISKTHAEVLKMYAVQLKPLLTPVNFLLERCHTAYDNTIGRNGKVSLTNKEVNHFYQKVLKRTKRVKSTVAGEVQRIEEVLKEIPIEQQQSLSEAIVQRKANKKFKKKFKKK